MPKDRSSKRTTRRFDDRATDVIAHLARRHATSVVLLHHALAEQMGLGPTDLKALDLLRERGALSGSDLAAITGLTTGAITGVVARLEAAGFLRREADLRDGRKQVLHAVEERAAQVHAALEPLRKDMAELLRGFDGKETEAISKFLARSTELIHEHVALLRARARLARTGDGGRT